MKQKITLLGMLLLGCSVVAQTNPIITKWLQNTTGITGRHYVSGNPTPIVDVALANVQSVNYNTTNVYVAQESLHILLVHFKMEILLWQRLKIKFLNSH